MKNDKNVIDFYVSIDIDGQGKKILLETLDDYDEEYHYQIEEKNYGRGADWAVELVNILVNDSLSAVLNLYAIYEIYLKMKKYIIENTKGKVLEPTKPTFFLGKITAAAFAAKYISDVTEKDDLELINSIELERGGNFNEKEFLILLKEKSVIEKDVQTIGNQDTSTREKVHMVHLNWREEILGYLTF